MEHPVTEHPVTGTAIRRASQCHKAGVPAAVAAFSLAFWAGFSEGRLAVGFTTVWGAAARRVIRRLLHLPITRNHRSPKVRHQPQVERTRARAATLARPPASRATQAPAAILALPRQRQARAEISGNQVRAKRARAATLTSPQTQTLPAAEGILAARKAMRAAPRAVTLPERSRPPAAATSGAKNR